MTTPSTAVQAAILAAEWLIRTGRASVDLTVYDERRTLEHGYTTAKATLLNEGGTPDWDWDLYRACTEGQLDLGDWYPEAVNNCITAFWPVPADEPDQALRNAVGELI